jgi:hypothetical protein
MRHSFTSQAEAIKNGMATGYITWLGMRMPANIPFNRGNLPNGFLIISAEDMAHYLIAQLNGGRYRSASIISPAGMAAMHHPDVPTGTPDEYYGMGWYIGEVDGTPAIYHSGANANFQTHILLLPEEKLGVAVMINVNGMPVNNRTSTIAKGVITLLKGNQPQPYVSKASMELVLALGSVYVPVAVSLVWIAWMVFRFIRRQKKGLPARLDGWWYFWVIGLPMVVDLSLVWVLLAGIPMLWGRPLSVMAGFFSDLFTLLIFTVSALILWGAARTALTLRMVKTRAVETVLAI